VCHCSSTPDESHAVSFVRHSSSIRAVHHHEMEHPWRLLMERPGPSRTKNCPPLFQYLGLHEEVTERRMQVVRGSRGKNNFGIAGYLNDFALACTVGERDAP